MIKFLVHRHTAVFTASILIILLGIFAYIQLPRESSPELKQPYVFVNTIYPGVAPADIEALLTRPLEEEIDGTEGVDEITSTSTQSASFITIRFNSDTTVKEALQRIKERVDAVKGQLPEDAQEPFVEELSSNSWPIFILMLSHPEGISRIEAQTEDLQEKLKSLYGALDVTLEGRESREVAIEADPVRLKHYGLSLDDLIGAIQSENANIPGGTLKSQGQNFTLAVTGEIQDLEDFTNIAIPSGPVKVTVGDVAHVAFTRTDTTSITRLNGTPALSLSLTKRSGTNLISLIDEAKEVIENHKGQLPRDTQISYVYDESRYVRDIILDLENNMFTGFVLVMLITLLFLGKRNSLFVSLAIPLSMLISFFVLQVMGITLNMIVLFSLILALGMLVDNGIVIVENVFRHAAQGKDRKQAAIEGTNEVAGPIIASTVTTCLAFFPIIFMPGFMGDFMKYVPITVIVVLCSSLFVALFINPVFLARFLKMDKKSMEKATTGSGRFMKIMAWYEETLRKALQKPGLWLGISTAIVTAGFVLYALVGKEPIFFPQSDPSTAIINLEAKQGTPLDQTNNLVKRVEQVIPGTELSLENYLVTVGQGASNPHKAEIRVEFTPFLKRVISGEEGTENLKEALKDFTGAELKFETLEDGPPTGHPVSYQVEGEDYAVMGHFAQEMVEILQEYPELKAINTDYEPATPEIAIEVDRKKAAYFELSTAQIASAIRTAVTGSKAGTYREGEKEYDVNVRLQKDQRNNLTSLKNLQIINRSGIAVPLQQVAQFKNNVSTGVIKRRNLVRTVGVWADYKPGVENKGEIGSEIAERFEALSLPRGYSINIGGGIEDQKESEIFLIQAFGVALFLIVIVLISQFNSLLDPAIITFSVFLSLGGVFWGYALTGQVFVIIMSGIGCIALAGVAVNNCIVLVDYTNILIRQGMPWKEAIVQSGKTRLRPVLLTALTTVLGLLPMAMGISFDIHTFTIQTGSEQAEFWKAFSLAMIYGLSFATIMTLIIVPSMLTLKFRFLQWKQNRKDHFPEDIIDELKEQDQLVEATYFQ